MLEDKQFKNMAFTGSNSCWSLSTSIENKLEEQLVVFSVAVNQDIYREEGQAGIYLNSITMVHTTSDKKISRTFQGFFKDKL